MKRDESFSEVQYEYERLRAEHPDLPHKDLWRLAEQAVGDGDGLDNPEVTSRNLIADRAEELVGTEGISWKAAWRQANEELNATTDTAQTSGWSRWFVAGFVSVLLSFSAAWLVDSSWWAFWSGESVELEEVANGFVVFLGLPAVVAVVGGILLGLRSADWKESLKGVSLVAAGIAAGMFVVGIAAVGDEDQAGLAVGFIAGFIFVVGVGLAGAGLLVGAAAGELIGIYSKDPPSSPS